ncbi:MAG: 1-acyl-sn-glycerol-3-phosphate acyltransferase [Kordiimonadaceae bacterium]|nr:1-acyl-sn-glycerol-3-phosphate acyltransferase [Kordiimonadaceae bacterium]MBT6034969.1 1-acyl-sn-glycerol-3-phosphate acyltransferase [Kordiimonadaceae bacterium]MBT6329184.1 1-acyl-sn-glycerol-3-phosphate acyltransferase [Kordiimonadaceae bacterium]
MMINATIFIFDKVANIKIEERGLENIPKDKGFIYCSKHMSNIDAYILFRHSPNLTAMAKKELFRVPLVNLVLNKMGVLAIDRGAGKAQKQTADFAKILIDKKLPMIIFAEGTRIPAGERRPLKSGVFYYQQEEDLDIIVVSHNSGVHWQKKSWIKIPGTIVVEYHPAMAKGLSKEDFMSEIEHRLLDRSDELML